jgi:hypothetical protein
MHTRALGTWSGVLLLVGSGCTVAGAVMVAIARTTESASFGWFAYAPISDTTFVPPAGPGAVRLFGYGVAVVGLVLLAWWLGTRRSPHTRAPFLPGASPRARVSLKALAAVAVPALLAGSSLLLSAPPGFPDLPDGLTPGREASVAYESDLTITWDDAYGPSLTPGLVLLVGGLVLTAVVLGRRTGRPSHPPAANGPRPRGTALAGLASVVVGLTLAHLPGSDHAYGDTSTPLGWALLLAGVGVGAGVTGFLLGARHGHPSA